MFRSKSHNHILSAQTNNTILAKDSNLNPAATGNPSTTLPAGSSPSGGGGGSSDPHTKVGQISPVAAASAAGVTPPASAPLQAGAPPPASAPLQRAPIARSKSGLLQHPEKVYPTGRFRGSLGEVHPEKIYQAGRSQAKG